MMVSSIAMGDTAVLAPSQVSTTVGGFFFDAPTALDGTSLEFDLAGAGVNNNAPNASRVNVESRAGFYTTQYDQVHVFDTLTLDGVVEIGVALQDDFIPSVGEFFDILSADQIVLNGSFDFNFPIAGGLTFEHEILNLLDPATISTENPSGLNRDVLRITFGVEAVFSPGDYNRDGDVDRQDYELWRASYGLAGQDLMPDGNQDGIVDAVDYAIWREALDAAQTASQSIDQVVPEPNAFCMLLICMVGLQSYRRK